MQEVQLIPVDLSESSLRDWAYDENVQFDFQDEDLLLHDERLLPILIPLMADPECPKAGYIAVCLDNYLKRIARMGDAASLAALEHAVSLCFGLQCPNTIDWARLQLRRLRYRSGLGPIGREEALIVAHDLLLGFNDPAGEYGAHGELRVFEETDSLISIERTWAGQHMRECVLIDRKLGSFVFLWCIDDRPIEEFLAELREMGTREMGSGLA